MLQCNFLPSWLARWPVRMPMTAGEGHACIHYLSHLARMQILVALAVLVKSCHQCVTWSCTPWHCMDVILKRRKAKPLRRYSVPLGLASLIAGVQKQRPGGGVILLAPCSTDEKLPCGTRHGLWAIARILYGGGY